MTDNVIDLTDSFTLADHTALANVVIELDDTLNDRNNSSPSRQLIVRHDVDDSIIEVSTSEKKACPRQHLNKTKSSKKKMQKAQQPRDDANREPIRERSPYDNKMGDCPICLEKLGTKPLSSTKCGHVFCLPCLTIALGLEKKCPTCRRALRGNYAYHPLFINRA